MQKEGIGGFKSYQRDRGSTESTTRHSATDMAPCRTKSIGRLDEAVELGATHLEVVTQRLVPLAQQSSEGLEIARCERFDEVVDPLHLGNGVTGSPMERLPEPTAVRFDKREIEIPERLRPEQGQRGLALFPPPPVFAVTKSMLHPCIRDENDEIFR